MGWAAQYDATYASAKLGDVEGDEQAEMESGGFEIGEYLGHVDGSKGLYGLDLHDERAIDEQVDPAFSNGDPLVLSGSPASSSIHARDPPMTENPLVLLSRRTRTAAHICPLRKP